MILMMFDRYVVLIVDDMFDNLVMLFDVFDESGYIVLVVIDGLVVLEWLDYIMFDLILFDVMMFGIDGFEICCCIKQVKCVVYVLVVFMMGLLEIEYVVCGFEVGGIDYVIKLICLQEVVVCIGVYICIVCMMMQMCGMLEYVVYVVIVLGGNGLLMWQISKVLQWLEKYYGLVVLVSYKLLGFLQVWFNEQLVWQCQGESLDYVLLLIVWQQQDELYIIFFGLGQGYGVSLVLEEKIVGLVQCGEEFMVLLVMFEGVCLMLCESDVLFWLGKGKINCDIVEIFGMSLCMVNKYLEYIFVKLGVEMRLVVVVLVSSLIGISSVIQLL